MNKTLKRELYVALHAQSFRFRIVKYTVLTIIVYLLYKNYGWEAVRSFFIFGIIIALGVHFLFRWKTNGWKKSWGPYKKII